LETERRKADNTIRRKIADLQLFEAFLQSARVPASGLFREAVALGLDNPTFEDRRQWLKLLQVVVTVTNQKAVISCRISDKPFTFNLYEFRALKSLRM